MVTCRICCTAIACVWVQGEQAAGNRPCGQREVTLDQHPGPVKLSLATGVIQVSAVSDMFLRPETYSHSPGIILEGLPSPSMFMLLLEAWA